MRRPHPRSCPGTEARDSSWTPLAVETPSQQRRSVHLWHCTEAVGSAPAQGSFGHGKSSLGTENPSFSVSRGCRGHRNCRSASVQPWGSGEGSAQAAQHHRGAPGVPWLPSRIWDLAASESASPHPSALLPGSITPPAALKAAQKEK